MSGASARRLSVGDVFMGTDSLFDDDDRRPDALICQPVMDQVARPSPAMLNRLVKNVQ